MQQNKITNIFVYLENSTMEENGSGNPGLILELPLFLMPAYCHNIEIEAQAPDDEAAFCFWCRGSVVGRVGVCSSPLGFKQMGSHRPRDKAIVSPFIQRLKKSQLSRTPFAPQKPKTPARSAAHTQRNFSTQRSWSLKNSQPIFRYASLCMYSFTLYGLGVISTEILGLLFI